MTKSISLLIMVLRLSLVVIITIGSARLTSAGEAQNTPVFLFQKDQEISNTSKEFTHNIQRRSLLKNDAWVNKPLTRLDYIVMNIQYDIKNNSFLSLNLSRLAKNYFTEGNFPLSVDLGAGYSEDSGRLFIGGSIDAHGKPKGPMKEFCRDAVTDIESSYPLKPIGYSWYNLLGILRRSTDISKYNRTITDLVSSSVVRFAVSTGYDVGGKYLFFQVGCMKQQAGGPLSYYKYSRKSRQLP